MLNKKIFLIDIPFIFTNTATNTMAMTMVRTMGEDRYTVVGFTPITSDLFEEIEPVTVTTLQPGNVTVSQIELKGSFSGISSVGNVFFEYTLNPDLTEAKMVTASLKGT